MRYTTLHHHHHVTNQAIASMPSTHALHYITLHAPLKQEWKTPFRGQRQAKRHMGGGEENLEKISLSSDKSVKTSREQLISCINRLGNRVRGQERLRICKRIAAHQVATMHESSHKSGLLLHDGKHVKAIRLTRGDTGPSL
jgi:hypothetical protein